MSSEKTANKPCSCPENSTPESCAQPCQGKLDCCGDLAVPHAAVQQENPTVYRQAEALAQGTLFPCLNLPFYLKVNGSPVPTTPLSELQALHFVLAELGLYLDTHPDDREAFALFQQYDELARTAKAAYEAQYGPLTQSATASQQSYTWPDSPWPWDVMQGGNN